MAKKETPKSEVLSYRHSDRRKNNPEVGVVNPDTDPDQPKTKYQYDPHIDPSISYDGNRSHIEQLIDDALQSKDYDVMIAALEQLKRQQSPYLAWAGKAEKTNFEVDTVSLHVHERIDPASILSAVRKEIKKDKSKSAPSGQLGLFNAPFENLPLRDAIDFYKHDRGWANRLIAGDSLLVMNSLLQKESMAGEVQMIYFDPPYGIKYGSNFQPFVDKKEVKDRKDEDLTQEPEMIKAFRDTWELGIHSYLTYLRDRIKLAHELLHDTGSIFIQISDENVHLVRNLLDEVFGAENFFSEILFTKKNMPLGGAKLFNPADYIVWYCKDIKKVKFNKLYKNKNIDENSLYNWGEFPDGSTRSLRPSEMNSKFLDENKIKLFLPMDARSSGYSQTMDFPVFCKGKEFKPSAGKSWATTPDGMKTLQQAGRIFGQANTLRYKLYLDDYSVSELSNLWTDTRGEVDRKYVVQTAEKVIERCILMTTEPGDLVFDPTCGSGTTATLAEKLGRRWITCDTSRVALTLAKQRLMTASFDYFELKYPNEGLKGGFIYKAIPHVTLKSIANNPEIREIYTRYENEIKELLVAINADYKSDKELTEEDYPFSIDLDNSSNALIENIEALRKVIKQRQELINASISSHADQDQLIDSPLIDKTKLRISGPFTVEAVPSPMVASLDEKAPILDVDQTISRSGESQRQNDWRNELIKTGIRGKNAQIIKLVDLEPLPDVKYLNATGVVADTGERVVVSFGPEYSLLEQRHVEMAMREAGELFPRPKIIIFCAFDFDPEAAKDIDSTKGIIALKVKMNADLLTDDLKKLKSNNQSFWLMGQPDVAIKKIKDDLWQVEVHGFDYFDTAKGELISGGKGNIASWMLDTDYDSRSLFPRQVFFPMAASKDGWGKLKKEIKAELDESSLAKFGGTISIPFEAGENKRIAVKIVDDRGIESLKVLDLED
ncbi:site-specific DNA-methyltransferase [Polynucleobacter paludilacus]|uniref:site-specific DNA-methyltransferase n=1 Tax=Polynucleobacter paludilacus TaxID=1855895 RepID=UPI001BFCE44A|nr:site-specific DNA-methyltransferase [Polynucleobacter paludilacus]QWD86377.1 site-specific DNA-methyltransferase [Polynucleobacter paludilacus]